MEIIDVKHIKDYQLEVLFDNGEKRIADFKTFLFKEQNPMTTQFRNIEKFKKVYVEFGHLTWEDGQMDISAQSIYNNKFSPI